MHVLAQPALYNAAELCTLYSLRVRTHARARTTRRTHGAFAVSFIAPRNRLRPGAAFARSAKVCGSAVMPVQRERWSGGASGDALGYGKAGSRVLA